ncbi:MAG: hypothetical protein JWM52_743 [Candidatus Saccharibacteria bacterium]|nr:hypothetical protein [Candidatus Saccharibacteria bacterium]
MEDQIPPEENAELQKPTRKAVELSEAENLHLMMADPDSQEVADFLENNGLKFGDEIIAHIEGRDRAEILTLDKQDFFTRDRAETEAYHASESLREVAEDHMTDTVLENLTGPENPGEDIAAAEPIAEAPVEIISEPIVEEASADEAEPVVPEEAEVVPEETTPAEVVRDIMDMPAVEVPTDAVIEESKAEEVKTETTNGEKDPATVEALSRIDNIESSLDVAVAKHQEQVDKLTTELDVLVGPSDESYESKLSAHRAKLKRIIQEVESGHGRRELLGEAIGVLTKLQEEMKQVKIAINESKLEIDPLRGATIEMARTTDDTQYQLKSEVSAFTDHAQNTMEPAAAQQAINELLNSFGEVQQKNGRIDEERAKDIINPRLTNLEESLARAEVQARDVHNFSHTLPDTIRARGLNTEDLIAVDTSLNRLLSYFEQARDDNNRFKQIPKPQPIAA